MADNPDRLRTEKLAMRTQDYVLHCMAYEFVTKMEPKGKASKDSLVHI
jgi:hypothetical protein